MERRQPGGGLRIPGRGRPGLQVDRARIRQRYGERDHAQSRGDTRQVVDRRDLLLAGARDHCHEGGGTMVCDPASRQGLVGETGAHCMWISVDHLDWE